jgi:PAS domain S-box-containing protein
MALQGGPRHTSVETVSPGTAGAGARSLLAGGERAAEERRRAEEFYCRIIESTHDCVKILDLDGRIVYLNPNGQQLLGICDLASFLHRPWVDLWEEPWKRMAAQAVEDARAGGKAGFQGFCRTFDGTPKWWDVAVTPIAGITGAVTELLSISRDISAQREALDALRESEARLSEIRTQLAHVGRITMLGTLTASIAHELTQPLTAVMSNASAAQRSLEQPSPDLAETTTVIADIVRDAQRAADIIEHFRTMLRRSPPSRESCDVNAIVREVVALVHGEAVRRRIALECRVEEMPPVWANRVELQQVLLNLLINAVDAVDGPSSVARTVTVRTSRGESGATVVSVEDHGPPVPDDQLRRMRDPFYTTKPEGLGLGLSICRELLAAHGSTLSTLRKEAGGMVFSFALPPEAGDAP